MPTTSVTLSLRGCAVSDGLAEVVAQVLLDEGGGPGSSLHSWRCEYPDRYGPCTCVADTADILADAVRAAGWRKAGDGAKTTLRAAAWAAGGEVALRGGESLRGRLEAALTPWEEIGEDQSGTLNTIVWAVAKDTREAMDGDGTTEAATEGTTE